MHDWLKPKHKNGTPNDDVVCRLRAKEDSVARFCTVLILGHPIGHNQPIPRADAHHIQGAQSSPGEACRRVNNGTVFQLIVVQFA